MTWNKSTTILTPVSPPNVLFLNTATPQFNICGVKQELPLPAPGVWHTIDLTPLEVPTDAIAVDIRGIVIITNGVDSGDTSLGVSFQIPGGESSVRNYHMQACAVGSTGGARTNAAVIVPCLNSTIDWGWVRGNSNGEWETNPIPSWPTGAAYGFNLNIHAIYLGT